MTTNPRPKANPNSALTPLNSVLYVSKDSYRTITPSAVKAEQIGEKAFGLTCLPKSWTLPFFVISNELLSEYIASSELIEAESLGRWHDNISKAISAIGIHEEDSIIIRSSGCTEGLAERGKFHSVNGMLTDLFKCLGTCLHKLATDPELNSQKIPLVVQKYSIPITVKGHLSNERRCYKEKRDWLGEYDDKVQPFNINLRNWRKQIAVDSSIGSPLKCNLSAHVLETLKIPAAWAYKLKARVHFEWVWDGGAIYIVQADQECKIAGIDPTQVYKNYLQPKSTFTPLCLKKVDRSIHCRFNKIKNIFIYQKLNLPTAPFYILDDQSVINSLAKGYSCVDLETDIYELIKSPLVIRMDIATNDLKKRQFLPRTEERCHSNAMAWLKGKSAEFRKNDNESELVFIFHNFIPAVSSAFAYAAPSARKVQVEALWGLPEGLYYNAHDNYIIDTQSQKIANVNVDKFVVTEKINYKHFFVSPDKDGRWNSKILKSGYDWKSSIQNDRWIKEIALESRRIAEEESRPVSIMWFVNVIGDNYKRKIIPWYHEPYELSISNIRSQHRKKTPFDKTLTIKTKTDIEILRLESKKKQYSIRQIKIQPEEHDLIRNKETLRDIGELTKKIDAVILLEGGVLSHAYYQLLQTKAMVEVCEPFFSNDDRQEYNKLVRDKIPLNIISGGESVNQARLTGEYLLRALREKLIEESFEVLDAIDQESIVSELADVSEIVNAIIERIGSSKVELQQKQKQKREKAGGFNDGVVLLDTNNPLPTKKASGNNLDLSDALDLYDGKGIVFSEKRLISSLPHKIDMWNDRRIHPAANETIRRLLIPMVLDNWVTELPLNEGESIRLAGKRIGSKYQLDLSFYNQEVQLDLFDEKDAVE